MKKTIIILVVTLMAAVGVWKYQSSNNNKVPVANNNIQQPSTADPLAPVVTDEGVSLPDAAKNSVLKDITDAGLGNYNSEDQEIKEEDQEIITVDAPNTLPREECLKKYKNYVKDIALYVKGNAIRDYAICHAVAESDIGYCEMGDSYCSIAVPQYTYTYKVLSGKRYSINECVQAYSSLNIPGWPHDKLCRGITDVLRGRTQPPSMFASRFLFLSGKTSSCANLKKSDKYDCLLMSDVVSGLRTGVNKFFLYDAFSHSDCKKIDDDLLEKYCTNKISPAPIKRSNERANERKQSGRSSRSSY
ncbi:MAG: hypothetical protein K5838_02340 [Elusimicrobiales bacterium]|nr:hypothetical protein [Elusimicrobiales bacterium]